MRFKYFYIPLHDTATERDGFMSELLTLGKRESKGGFVLRFNLISHNINWNHPAMLYCSLEV